MLLAYPCAHGYPVLGYVEFVLLVVQGVFLTPLFLDTIELSLFILIHACSMAKLFLNKLCINLWGLTNKMTVSEYMASTICSLCLHEILSMTCFGHHFKFLQVTLDVYFNRFSMLLGVKIVIFCN